MEVYKNVVKLMIASVMLVIALGTSACGSHHAEQSEMQEAESKVQATAESDAQAAEIEAQAAVDDGTSAVTETGVHVATDGSEKRMARRWARAAPTPLRLCLQDNPPASFPSAAPFTQGGLWMKHLRKSLPLCKERWLPTDEV